MKKCLHDSRKKRKVKKHKVYKAGMLLTLMYPNGDTTEVRFLSYSHGLCKVCKVAESSKTIRRRNVITTKERQLSPEINQKMKLL